MLISNGIFRQKIETLIAALNNRQPSAVDPIIDDDDALNDHTFQSSMDELMNNLPSGGGSGSITRLEVTASDPVEGTITVTTVMTAGEVEELFESGNFIYIGANIGAYSMINVGLFLTPDVTGSGYVLYAYTKGDSSGVMAVTFTASTENDHLTAQISLG